MRTPKITTWRTPLQLSGLSGPGKCGSPRPGRALPLVLAFCGDAGREIVTNGFAALDTCPDWYKAMLGVILSAVFASRQAAKFMGKK